MKIKMTEDGKIIEAKESFAHRLIEQGKAVPVKTAAEPAKKEQKSGA